MIINQRIKRIGVGFLAITAVWVAYNQFSSKEVKMAEAQRRLFQDYLKLPGQVDVTPKEIVCSKYSGIVNEIRVTEGCMVAPAQEMMRLRLTDYSGSLEKANAAYQATQAKIASMKKKGTAVQLQRSELQLMQARAIADETRHIWEETKKNGPSDRAQLAENAMTEAARQVASAEHDFQMLKEALTPRELLVAEAELKRLGEEVAQLRQTEGEVGVFATKGGLVLKTNVTAGAKVSSGMGLIELGNNQNAYIRATVPDGQRALVRPGQKVMISGDALRKNVVKGTVAADSSPLTELRVKYDNDRIILKYGSQLQLKVLVREADDVICIPAAAVFRRFGKSHVYVVENGTAVLRPVQTGISNNDLLEIKSGLFAGERVIVDPGLDLRPGMKVVEGKEL